MKRLSALLIFLSLTLPVAHTQASSGDVAASDRLAPALPLSPQTVDEIDSLMATPPFDQGVWGLEVRDLATGQRLLAINPHRQFQAASTTKNFTTAATLDALGRNHRFRTPVTHTGRITRSGTLHGNLVLVASGDLTMGGREKPDGTVDYTGFDHTDSNEVPGPATLTPQNPLRGLNDLARQVKRSGIDRVRKDIVIDDRLWQQTLVNHEEISPIIINDNVIDITMTPTSPGQRVAAETRPATGVYRFDVRARTVAPGGELDLHVGRPHAGRVLVRGTIPAGTDPVVQVLRVPRPAYLARSLFYDALQRAGVRIDAPRVGPNRAGALPPQRQLLQRRRDALRVSPPLSEFVKLISKVSHNPGSNTAPFWIGAEAGHPTMEGGMREIRAFLRRAGIDPDQFELVDGQGGPGNKFSPTAMVELLDYVQDQPYAKAFLTALPVKGVDGLPEDPELDPATGHVFQKNGVNGALDANGRIEVQAMALAGYARAGRRLLAFDLVANHIPVVDSDGNPSQAPGDLVAAFTRFQYHEAITSLLYTSQLGSG